MIEPKLLEILNSLKDEVVGIRKEMATKAELNEFREETNNRFASVDERLDNLQHTCTRIEVEHGKKLDLALDYIKGNIERQEQYMHNFAEINSKLLDHSIRLSIIESTEAFQSAFDRMKKETLKSAT